MARGLFPGGAQPMATRVVLYHSSQGYQVGGSTCLSLGSHATTNFMGQQGARLGACKGCARIAEPHLRSPRERCQSGHGGASYVNPLSPALQTSSRPPVGVQPGGTAS